VIYELGLEADTPQETGRGGPIIRAYMDNRLTYPVCEPLEGASVIFRRQHYTERLVVFTQSQAKRNMTAVNDRWMRLQQFRNE
jgi:hypothetical protein